MSFQPFLIRYDQPLKTVFIDIIVPTNFPEKTVGVVQRISSQYIFASWETPSGITYAAEFILKPNFFDLDQPPSTLSIDMQKLAQETGLLGLCSDSIWLTVILAELLAQE